MAAGDGRHFPYRKVTGLSRQQQYELLQNFTAVAQRTEPHTISSIGPVAVSTSSTFRVLRGGSRMLVYADLDTALTGDTDIDIVVNGTVVDTITVPSGETSADELRIELLTKRGDLIAVECTAVGTGTALATVTIELGH